MDFKTIIISVNWRTTHKSCSHFFVFTGKKEFQFLRGGCGQILGPTMTGRKKNVVYGGREKESTSIV